MLMFNSPSENHARTTFENVNFGVSILAFGISFTPAWLYWARSASECVEKQLCRQPGERFSFENESMMEVASETTDDAVMMAWRKRMILLYATPNSRHGSLSPVAASFSQNQQQAQSANRAQVTSSAMKSQRYRMDVEDRDGDENDVSVFSSKKKNKNNKKTGDGKDDSPPISIIYPPKELLACSRSHQKRNNKKIMKRKRIMAKKMVKRRNEQGEEVEVEIEEEIEVEVTDSDQSDHENNDKNNNDNNNDEDQFDGGGVFPPRSSSSVSPASVALKLDMMSLTKTPEAAFIVESLMTSPRTNTRGGNTNNNNINHANNSHQKWKVYEYDDDENSVLSPPNLLVNKSLFTVAGTNKSALALAMADPKSPVALAHRAKTDDDRDCWGNVWQPPPPPPPTSSNASEVASSGHPEESSEKNESRKPGGVENVDDKDDKKKNKKNKKASAVASSKTRQEEKSDENEDDDDPFRN